MSKRMLSLITLLMLLAVVGVTQAQVRVTPSGEPVFLLTEEQINSDFQIPGSKTRQISNLEVDVQEDGVHVSFQVTITQNGRSNTLNIIAILIGLFDEPRVSSLELENTMISNYIAPTSLRDEVSSLVLRSWNTYEADVLVNIPTEQLPTEGIIMRDGGICDPIRWGC